MKIAIAEKIFKEGFNFAQGLHIFVSKSWNC